LTPTTSTRAFTLDDGTTTLVLSNGQSFQSGTDKEAVTITAATNFLTFTFVGTGLDITQERTNVASGVYSIFVDGTSIASSVIGSTLFSTVPKVIKIVSGLPYGTHTVKIVVDTSGTDCLFGNFIVYGPSKPSIPSGAIELADYYLMADYVASTVATRDFMPTGTLRKSIAGREAVYVGTWTTGLDVGNFENGLNTQSAASSSSVSYVFFGTGFEWSQFVFTNAMSATYTLDGVTNFTASNSSPAGGAGWSGALTTQLLQTSSGLSFTASSGVLSGTSAGVGKIRLRVTGLTLGFHTVKFTTANANQHYAGDLDIITPIHSPKINQPGDLQNVLPVGSCAIGDSRKFASTAVKTLANWAQAKGITSGPTTTSTVFVPVPDLSATIKTNGNPIVMNYYVRLVADAAGRNMQTAFYVDGAQVGSSKAIDTASANFDAFNSDNIIVALAAGTHKIDVYWLTNAGTATAKGISRNLTAREI
jgi:hypothetical protein